MKFHDLLRMRLSFDQWSMTSARITNLNESNIYGSFADFASILILF